MKPRTLRTYRSRRGSTVTEFAIWLPVMVIIFSGMVDLSWQLSQYQKLVRITRDAARVAAATYENPQFMEPGSLSIIAGEDYARDACARLNMDDCDIEVERLLERMDKDEDDLWKCTENISGTKAKLNEQVDTTGAAQQFGWRARGLTARRPAAPG